MKPCGSTDKARDRTTGEIVALKKLRMDRERDGVLLLPYFFAAHSSLKCCLQLLNSIQSAWCVFWQ